MTAIDYEALAERIKVFADHIDNVPAQYDDEVADLRTVVSLLREMAHREAVQYAHADGCWAWGPRHYECALREIDRLHSAPQPTPGDWQLVPKQPTPEMLAATSWPGCAVTDYRHMLAAAPHPAPQPHPIDPHMIAAEDRFPDEPTEAQIEAAADVIRPHLHGDADPPSFIAMDALRAALAAKE